MFDPMDADGVWLSEGFTCYTTYRIVKELYGGIDVSKGKGTVAVRRLGGEVELKSFQVDHDIAGLSSLIKTLCGVGWNIRVVMEHLGMYWRPIALALKEVGFH